MEIWDSILSFINNNAPLWSFLVTIATIVYVVLTNKMLKESERVRKLQYRPYVIADIGRKGSYIWLTVKNLGNDSASKIKIDISNLKKNPFSNIEFIAPGAAVSTLIGFISLGDNKPPENSIYKINMSYEDSGGSSYQQNYDIDISPLLNSIGSGNSSIDDIVKEIHEANKKIDKLTDQIKEIPKTIGKNSDNIKDVKNILDKKLK